MARYVRLPSAPRAVAGLVAVLVLGSASAQAGRLAGGPSTAAVSPARQPAALAATVDVSLNRPRNVFRPASALGGGLDGHAAGETAQIYTRSNLRAMLGAGLGDVSYRLRTELGVQAWHIDPAGRFSDPAHAQGYWTSTSRPSAGVGVSWGYSLPRRGDTIDQADNSGYSRLDDGRLDTFWKSDPYLDTHFTHEAQSQHAQWVVIDLGHPRPVDALRIAWAAPYATHLQIQRYVGPDAVALAPGHWSTFARGDLHGHPGTQTVRFAALPIAVRSVRLLLLASSHTAPPGSHDVRDRLGYAISEIGLGTLDARGGWHDLLIPSASARQSTIYTSSTDSWHRASDRDPGYEQPSFQTVLASGLTHGDPVLVPVPVLYGTPEGAVAELRYLHALHMPLRGVELGEEPDGQLSSPEDYGALYLQFARAIRAAFPHLPLGGPGFATSLPDWLYWPDAHGDRSWTHRFLRYLQTHRALGLLDFFSFEWYPWDNVCAPPGPQLARSSATLTGLIALQRAHGLPSRLALYVTEYGYSAFAGQDEVDLPGALLDADTVGTLLQDGASAAYLYGYEPDILMRESRACDTWGNLVLLQGDSSHRALHRLSTFWETRMLTHDWTLAGDRRHTLYATRSNATDHAGQEVVRAYTVRRPDGRLAVLLLNLSPSQPYDVTVRLSDGARGVTRLGRLHEWQLSAADYRWAPAGPAGHPGRDLPPLQSAAAGGSTPVRLPPYSVTVLRTDAAK